MTKCSGSINTIETMGTLDGPGVRVVVFLNGCNLRCIFCHNPEMWNLKDDNITAEELANKIIRYKPYFNKNGGVTFSGGEPLVQYEFIKELARLLKKSNIHIALDTAGCGNFDDELLDLIDLVIFDIKALDEESYLNITKNRINKSLEFLNACQVKNKELWIRQVIIPGINDNYEYMDKLKKFISNIKNVTKVELLPYHTMAKEKYKNLKIKYEIDDIPAMDKTKCDELQKYLLK